MQTLALFRTRLLAFWHKREFEAEMEEELRFHLRMRMQENVARGMSPAEARTEASRRFGNLLSVKDACRDEGGGGVLEAFRQDIRFAARMLRRDRALSLLAALTLALGIGANAVILVFLNAVLFRPLPFPGSEKLVWMTMLETSQPTPWKVQFSYPDFSEVAVNNHSFSAIGGYSADKFIVQVAGQPAREVRGAFVTPGLFPTLGAQPERGRAFAAADEKPGARSAIVSHEFWQDALEEVSDLSAARVTVDGEACRVVGVMPSTFRFPLRDKEPQVWTTFARLRESYYDGTPPLAEHRDSHFVATIGRLKPGMTAQMAKADLTEIVAASARKYPQTNAHMTSCAVEPWGAEMAKPVRRSLLLLVGAGFCLLGVACVNVTSLLLSRAGTRRKELALRVALGAGQGRMLWQSLTESLLMAALGGALGLLIALAGTAFVVRMLPPDFPRLHEIGIDGYLLVFVALLSVIAWVCFGIAPAWRAARCDLGALRSDAGGKSSGATKRNWRTRNLLVICEMTFAFLLVVGAAGLLRALWKIETTPLGFNPQNTFVAPFSLAVPDHPNASEEAAKIYGTLLSDAEALPEFEAASLVYPLPFTKAGTTADFEIIGRRKTPKSDWPRGRAHVVAPNYFRTMQIPLRRGRDFASSDGRHAPLVAIVNETLAHDCFPNENPIGRKIRPGVSETGTQPEREIVGVVADSRSDGATAPQRAEIYLPHAQCASSEMALVVRTSEKADAVVEQLQRLRGGRTTPLVMGELRMMRDYVTDEIEPHRLGSSVLGIFAVLAVLLSAVGIHGVMSCSVVERRHEIGIRLALGAPKLAVFGLILREGFWFIGCSAITGGFLSWMALHFIFSSTHGTNTGELPLIAIVTALMALIGFLACCRPAQRAAHEDPIAAIQGR